MRHFIVVHGVSGRFGAKVSAELENRLVSFSPFILARIDLQFLGMMRPP